MNGYSVLTFLVGNAVQLIRDAVLDTLAGVGAGKLHGDVEVYSILKDEADSISG